MPNLPPKESLTVEFKKSFNEEIVETLVAFSNAKGGTIFVGVSDTGKVQGLTVGKETIPNWINEVKNKTNPQIIPEVEVLNIDNKIVVSLFVIEYPIKPVSTKGKYYKRVGNSNHLLSIDEIANEHLKTINSSWDFYIDPLHTKTDLSEEKILQFANKIRQVDNIKQVGLSDNDILNKMEILRNGEVTFGAYLLFVKDYCSISDVQIGRFKSNITIIDSISLNADLFQEVEDIMAFIKRHLKIEYIITGNPQHTERFDYPLDAIREVVMNMVVHRDYRDSSASIIKIFDNRIEFYNPGKLYGGITVEDLFTGNYLSKSRNKLIAKAFKATGLIERYGSGIMRVCKICSDYGVRAPEFKEISNGFQVILYNERLDNNDLENVPDVVENVLEKVTEKENVVENDLEKVTEKENVVENDLENVPDVVEKITEKENVIENRMDVILEIIKNNNCISAQDMAHLLKINLRTVQRDISELKSKGIIERIGADRGGYWKIN